MTKHDHGLKEKVEGAIDKVKGEVKEVVEKVTDNKKLQAEGKWDKVKGTAKDTVGNVKEKVHEYKEHKKEK
ncbi:TPA: CsbD family protein [Bacillus cereus]|nr:CsbD family protein [Bacillus cereus]